MKERPILFSGEMVRAILDGRKTQTRREIKGASGAYNKHGVETLFRRRYGEAGDQLWVKETFSAHGSFGAEGRIVYRADIASGKQPNGLAWKPAIFMPRKSSRITLEITKVRVERLQDISELDARAEGVIHDDCEGFEPTNVSAYRRLWESINGSGSWADNPWVWVIEFKPMNATNHPLPACPRG